MAQQLPIGAMGDVGWRDLLPLLHGNAATGAVASKELVGVVSKVDLSLVFHEIITKFLLQISWNTRTNSGFALQLLVRVHAADLGMLLNTNNNDGKLLILNEFDIDKLLLLGSDVELRNVSCDDKADGIHIHQDGLYGMKWLKNQRKQLVKRLNLEADNVVITSANAYGKQGLQAIIEDEDLITNKRRRNVKNCDANNTEDNTSSETWLARLIRFLVVGLMDSRWETRHGSSIGLTSIINGLFPSTTITNSEIVSNTLPLPLFLVEDVICSALYLLVLDRFLDFGTSISAISPVKEASGMLIGSSMRYCTPEMASTMNTLVTRMCQYVKSDNAKFIRHGGLIAYKYILPLNSIILHPYYHSIVEITTSGLGDLNDDISSVSAQVVCSLCKGVDVIHHHAVDYSPTEELESLIRSMGKSAAMLNALSCRVADLLEGANSVVKLLQVLVMSSERLLSMYSLIVDMLSVVMSKLYLFTEYTKSLSITLILQLIRLMNDSIDCIQPDPADRHSDLKIVVSITKLVTCMVCALSCKPAQSLGDLFLVDKKEQNRAASSDDKSGKDSIIESAITNELMLDCGKIIARFCMKTLNIVTIKDSATSKSSVHSSLILNEIVEIMIKWEANGADIASVSSKCVSAGAPSKRKGRASKKVSSTSTTLVSIDTMKLDNVTVMDAVTCACKEVLAESLLHMTVGDSKNHQIVMNSCYNGLGYFRFTDEVCRLRVSRFIADFSVEIGIINSISLVIFNRLQHSLDNFIAIANAAAKRPAASKSNGFRFVIVCEDDGEVSDYVDDDDDILSQLVPASSKKKTKFDAKRKLSESTPISNVSGTHISDLLPIEPYLLNLQIVEIYLAVLVSMQSQGCGCNNMAAVCECVEKLLHLRQLHAVFNVNVKVYDYHKKTIELFMLHRSGDNMTHYHRLLDVSEKWSATVQDFLSLLVSDACTQKIDGARNTECLQKLLHQNYYTQELVHPLAMLRASKLIHVLVLRMKYDFFVSILPIDVYLYRDGSYNQEKRSSKVMLVLLCHAILMSNSDSKTSLLRECMTTRLLITVLNKEVRSIITEMASTNTVLHTVIDCCCHLISSCNDSTLKMQRLQELVQHIATLPSVFNDFVLPLPKLQLIKGFLLNILVTSLKEGILPTYSLVMSHVVVMLGDPEYAVRKHAMDTLRVLVPLAPAAYLSQQKHNDSASPNILQVLLSRNNNNILNITMSSSPQDKCIIDHINQSTPLFQIRGIKARVTAPMYLCSVSLREYQLEGVSWITYLRRHGMGAILADEMGLGKTIQALSAIAVQVIENKLNITSATDIHIHPSLIICPASLLLHWQSEISNNFPVEILKPLPICKYLSGVTTATDPFLCHFGETITSSTVVIISYETFRREHAIFASPELLWNTVVLDEAHIIKNPRTAVAIYAFTLKSRMRVALSGTPVQNNIEELWSIMNFILPDFLGTYQDFNTNFIKPIRKSFQERERIQQSIVDNGKANSSLFSSHKMQTAINVSAEGLSILQKLHKQVLPFILRRTKANVAKELPRKTIIDVHCPLSPLQRKLYGEFQEGLKIRDDDLANELNRIKEQEIVGGVRSTQPRDSYITPLRAFTYLKLLSVHPALIISQAHGAYRKRIINESGSSGKMIALARLLIESCVVRSDECRFYHTLFLSDSGTNDVYVDDSDDSANNIADNSDSDGDDNKAEILVMDRETYMKQAQIPKATNITTVEEKRITPVADGANKSGNDASADNDDRLTADTAAITDTPDDFAVNIRDKILLVSTKNRKLASQNTLPSRFSARVSEKNVENNSNMSADTGGTAQSLHKFNRGDTIHRCLIFAQHTSVLDIIETCVLKKYFPNINYLRLDGSVDPYKRGEIANRFDEQKNNSAADDIRILLMTTRACGLGLNLTAADTVIFVEHDWNPYVDMQAMDRAHRIGQTKPVMVYRLLAESTIEARLINIQELKQTIVDELINNNNDISSASNSNNELGKSLWNSISSLVDNDSLRSSDDINRIDYEAMNIESFLNSVNNTD